MPTCPFCKNMYITGEELQDHLDVKHPDETTDVTDTRRIQPKKFKRTGKKQPIVVDGDDIAKSGSKEAKTINIKKLRSFLHKQGYSAEIFISDKLRKIIDDEFELQRLINLKWVTEIEEDEIYRFMLDSAQKNNCAIVSNFKFSKYQKDYEGEWDLKESLKTYTLNNGKFELTS